MDASPSVLAELQTHLMEHIKFRDSQSADTVQRAAGVTFQQQQRFEADRERRLLLSTLQYINGLYPFSDTAARFFCLLLSEDQPVN